jgi:hypothetical protein
MDPSTVYELPVSISGKELDINAFARNALALILFAASTALLAATPPAKTEDQASGAWSIGTRDDGGRQWA